MSGYIGVNNISHKISKIYIGDSTGHAKDVSKAYVGVNNLSQLWYGNTTIPKTPYVEFVSNSYFEIFVYCTDDTTSIGDYISMGYSAECPYFEISTDKNSWTLLGGDPYFMYESIKSAKGTDNKYHLYMRNGDPSSPYYTTNTRLGLCLTYEEPESWDVYTTNYPYKFYIATSNQSQADPVYIIGYLAALLDYEALMNGDSDIEANSYCFEYAFSLPDDRAWEEFQALYGLSGYKAFTDASKLSFDCLGDSSNLSNFECYCQGMFAESYLLHSPKQLPLGVGDYSFEYMFLNCRYLLDAPEIPKEDMAWINDRDSFVACEYAYAEMFSGCTALIKGPTELPATILGPRCYQGMFRDCSSLQVPPRILATSLINIQDGYPTIQCDEAFWYMFYGCTSLLTIPNLQIEYFTDSDTGRMDYYEIFKGCNPSLVSTIQDSTHPYQWKTPNIVYIGSDATPYSYSTLLGSYGLPLQYPSSNIYSRSTYYLQNPPV